MRVYATIKALFTPKKETKQEPDEQKYIVDFGNQVYGVIITVNNRKEMYQISSNPPGIAQPNTYTFDEIAATNLKDYTTLKPVNTA